MKVLNIKNVPVEMMKQLKMESVVRDMTMRELVIGVIDNYFRSHQGSVAPESTIDNDDNKWKWGK